MQINVTGNIVASPCQIDASNMTQNINLGDDLQASDLNSPGSTTTWKNFYIHVTNCPAGTTSVVATFHGAPDDQQPEYYKNNGTAKNIVVQLDTQGGGYVLKDGFTLQRDIKNGSADYDIAARGYSKDGGVTPGTLSASITVDIVYK